MDFFGVLTMLGGLALFLYGMETMGKGLEKLSGGRLERILEKLTSNPIKAVLLGAGVTAIIQSSSATTVMVVGFVNSGIMKLTQAVGIIMGANIGTTVTSWLLSLTGIESGNFFVTGSGAHRRLFYHVLQEGEEKRCRNHHDRFRDFNDRNGDNERCRQTAGKCPGIYRNPDNVLKPGPRNDRRRCPHSDHPELLCVRRYSSGVMRHRCGEFQYCTPDHHGTEYRNLCDSDALRYRCLKERKARGTGPSLL